MNGYLSLVENTKWMYILTSDCDIYLYLLLAAPLQGAKHGLHLYTQVKTWGYNAMRLQRIPCC